MHTFTWRNYLDQSKLANESRMDHTPSASSGATKPTPSTNISALPCSISFLETKLIEHEDDDTIVLAASHVRPETQLRQLTKAQMIHGAACRLGVRAGVKHLQACVSETTQTSNKRC